MKPLLPIPKVISGQQGQKTDIFFFLVGRKGEEMSLQCSILLILTKAVTMKTIHC